MHSDLPPAVNYGGAGRLTADKVLRGLFREQFVANALEYNQWHNRKKQPKPTRDTFNIQTILYRLLAPYNFDTEALLPAFSTYRLAVAQDSGSAYAMVIITCAAPSVSFTVVAVHAPPHEPLEPLFDELQLHLSQITMPFVIMAGDFNAKHRLWGPVDGDTRGAQLAQFTAANNLIVLNDPRSPPTFQSPLAESWIDVSFASVPLASCGYSWAVVDLVIAKFYAIFDRLCRAHSRWVKPRQQSTNSWWTPALNVERKRKTEQLE
ncbi:hypothetical protein HPB49_014610 [Dermacentor silvarum]|uniref:Uncharacterized protein n=1 Tax=Dermacentor silvarum TaxID=543639 RepID=A0ACB8CFH8_DERSI|nr:hypothetical protein HPB49_014610 [Dermacentor silvarum]